MTKSLTEEKKLGKAKKWFIETKSELKKVTWPTGRQTLNNTNIVFLMILMFGALVWIFDFGLMELLNLVLDRTKDTWWAK